MATPPPQKKKIANGNKNCIFQYFIGHYTLKKSLLSSNDQSNKK